MKEIKKLLSVILILEIFSLTLGINQVLSAEASIGLPFTCSVHSKSINSSNDKTKDVKSSERKTPRDREFPAHSCTNCCSHMNFIVSYYIPTDIGQCLLCILLLA